MTDCRKIKVYGRQLFRFSHELALSFRNMILFRAFPTPDGAWFIGRGRLFVDLTDRRGLRVRRRIGVSSAPSTAIWQQMVKSAAWQTVLDIGANYGEMTLSVRYGSCSTVYLFEANPYLKPYLARSIAAHRDSARMQLYQCVVSDKEGRTKFTVDRKWSGTSSAMVPFRDPEGLFKGGGEEIFEEVDLVACPIDVMLESRDVGPLVFKIDVEGYEFHVLRGMARTLAKASCFIGLVEVDTDRLAAAGEPAHELVPYLSQFGVVARIGRDGPPKVINPSWRPPPAFHTDLLLASDPGLLSSFRLPYLVRGPSRRQADRAI
jgi:FkbM family methyltransferase